MDVEDPPPARLSLGDEQRLNPEMVAFARQLRRDFEFIGMQH